MKELRHGQRMLKKLAIFFKFVGLNRSSSSSVETILDYFCVFIIPLVFPMLENYYSEVFLQFQSYPNKGYKHHDIAPLKQL